MQENINNNDDADNDGNDNQPKKIIDRITKTASAI